MPEAQIEVETMQQEQVMYESLDDITCVCLHDMLQVHLLQSISTQWVAGAYAQFSGLIRQIPSWAVQNAWSSDVFQSSVQHWEKPVAI